VSDLKKPTATYEQATAIDNARLGKSFKVIAYAGTGKTTLISGIIKYLKDLNYDTQLMAPTGRAAKIVQEKTTENASTIHKGIYSFSELEEIKTGSDKEDLTFLYQYKVSKVENLNSVIIIDEASMVSDVCSEQEFFRFGTGKVLEDLAHYSRINDPTYKTKIILVGDPAQLPPVGMNFSPALDEEYLTNKFKISVSSVELKEVKRLDKNNNILHKATKIRESLESGYYNGFNLSDNGLDVFNVELENFIKIYNQIEGKKIVISYKNSTQNYVNQQIRLDKYGADLPVQKGDVMIVGKNNYNLGLMNGEFGLVNEVSDSISRTISFRKKGSKGELTNVTLVWRGVSLIVRNEVNKVGIVSGYFLENYLYGDGDLSSEERQALYVDFMVRHPGINRNDKQFGEKLKNDAFFNSLMLQFGYAITCHKAQGGEWDNVIVFWDKGTTNAQNNVDKLSHKGKSNSDFYRWAYTAITRSSRFLYCIESPYFSPYSSMFFVDADINDKFLSIDTNVKKDIDLPYTVEISNLFKDFGLETTSTYIRDHFLSIWYQLKNQDINILLHSVKNYEVHYQFGKDNDRVGVKFWFNGKGEFRPNFQNINSLTNSPSLFELISNLVTNLPVVNLVREDISLIESKIEPDFTIEENKPFLRNLEEELNALIAVYKINIEDIQHLNYKERFTFILGREKTILDIDYNDKGFFGRILPLQKMCNSLVLLNDLQEAFNQLKKQDYVFQRD